MVVFRLRDPALITNDNLESIMANSNSPFGLAPIKAEGGAIDYDTGTATIKSVGRYNLTDHMTGTTTLKNHGKPVEIRPFEVNPDMTMLNDASSPYNVDPETLANLWVVRFGKGWVGNEVVETLEMDTEQVEWWRHAANRLRELGYLEMHTLASSYRVVLRIVE